jgi:hypothetical protein
MTGATAPMSFRAESRACPEPAEGNLAEQSGAEMTIKETFELPDGRVAVIFRWQRLDAEYGYLVASVEQDGRWLVDELVEISPTGEGMG